MFCCVCGTYQQETFMHTHLKVSILCASVCTVRSGTSLLCGGECLHRGSRVSHLDASSCDGNRNGQKSEAGTANGSLKPQFHTLLFHSLYPRYLSSRLLFLKSFVNLRLSLHLCLPLSHLYSPSSRLSVTSLSLLFLLLFPISVSPWHLLVLLHLLCSLTLTQSTIMFLSPLHFLFVCFHEWKQSGKAQQETDIYEDAPLDSVKSFKFTSSSWTELLQAN